ncbi:hypothetical protein KAR91_31665 [Candidatus Pacearchaeota archaeon]|nr:hypothetical protein [Candidatus Pacearchaeota archaeon]
MCKWDKNWKHTVSIMVDDKHVCIDSCIVTLVKVLNGGGFKTVASCCGHGNRPGSIIFSDGTELAIFPNWESARKIDRLFSNIHGRKEGKFD